MDLEALSRQELQTLFKTHGLKGANGKVNDSTFILERRLI
jgi:hypothetical protein